MATETLSVKITASDTSFSSTLNKMYKNLDKTTKKLEGLNRFGDEMKNVGKKLTMGLTVPIAGIAVASTKSAIDIESAFAGVRKTMDVSGLTAAQTEQAYKKVEDGIMSMSKKMPTAATEIAGVAEAAGQLGIKTENILGFTEVMVQLGDTTNLSAEEAATSLARLANITGMPQTQFDRLGSTIVALGNNMATTESEITAMGLRLAGAGKQIGLTEAQTMSFAAALSSVGIEAEAGGSAFSKVMVDMQLATEKGGKKLQQFASVAGMSASEFKVAFQKDASSAIIAFIKGLGDAESKGQSAIGILDKMGISEVRLRDTLLRAAGASDLFTNALNIGTQAWDENNALTNEANVRYETTESKIQMAKNALIAMGKSIGDILLPAVTNVCEWVTNMANKFTELNPTAQTVILVIAALIAAIGPLLIIAGSLLKGFVLIQASMMLLGTTFTGLITTVISAVAPFIAIVAAIGLFIAALVKAYNENESFRNKVNEVFSQIKSIVSDVMSIVKDVISMAWGLIKVIWNNGLSQILGFAGSILASIVSIFTSRLSKATSVVRTAISLVKAIFSGDFKGAESIVNGILQNIVNGFNRKMDSAKKAVSNAINAIKGFFNFSWSLPKLKMPHISITGGFSLMPPKAPRFSVSWYSKGAIFKRPTVMGGMGIGDKHNGIGSGAEAILPINKLPQLLGLDKQNNSGNLSLNIENFNNNREQDIKELVEEIAFYLRRKNIAIGG